ncbi:MAG: hypothetical protein ABIJ73_07740 [Pseudomonadota bacterium]
MNLIPTLLLAIAGTTAPPSEVVVLSTLHGLHTEVAGYDESALARAIEMLEPAVLCLELSPEALAERRPEKVKVEYPNVVYPLLDRRGYATCTLEPPAGAAQAIIGPYAAASQAFASTSPEQARAFSDYSQAMYALLRHHWRDAASVNDTTTDQLMQGKHAVQEALIGPGEAEGWAAWNRHFSDRIREAAKRHPGKRIVVLVGAEHGYWLRRDLAGAPGITLLDTPDLLTTL